METRNTVKTILRVDALPTLPDVIHEILAITGDPMSSMKGLATVIERDPALSANMLKLVNSAYFGFSRKISVIRDAGVLLGYGTVRAMALGTVVISSVNVERLDCHRFWAHSLATAVTTNALAREVNHPDLDQAFIAGLLHDVGVLLLAVSFPDLSGGVPMAGGDSQDAADREIAAFGITHEQAGAHLARHWRFDARLTRAIEEHHLAPGREPERMSALGRMVWLAEWMLGERYRLPHEEPSADRQAEAVARSLGYPLDLLRGAAKRIDKELGIVEPLLSGRAEM
ncbi:MAG: HDOD domain-containing protein [Nitrospirae bacterium]|nr:HDOD domain-containing protein [Nitrospirota bacterium]